MTEYEALKERLATGWNTWNTRSVLSHVLLPYGFAINLGIKEYRVGHYLKEAFIGSFGDGAEVVQPGPHAYDGSYTELSIQWKDIVLKVQTAVVSGDIVILVTPSGNQVKPAALVVEAGMLWNRPGKLSRDGNILQAELPGAKVSLHTTGEVCEDPHIPAQGPYLSITTSSTIGISSGTPRSLQEIRGIIEGSRERIVRSFETYGECRELYEAMQTCMAWDTVYDPSKERVISPVSRIWSVGAGGYVLFCWDSYFAALLAGFDNKELGYAGAIEITREMTDKGFVPNTSSANGFKTLDRSQPPVGSMAVRELYRKYRDDWFVDELFEDLISWNRWWHANRRVDGNLLAWGSNPYQPVVGNPWETEKEGVGGTYGGALESGLDNSPMYDGIPFNPEAGVMELADVGLTSLYIMDCRCLAELAEATGRTEAAKELRGREALYEEGLRSLWSPEAGIYLNRRTDTGDFSERLSPTNFYSLLSPRTDRDQVERMIEEHFHNPEEFWGDYIMPSISRSDPAYKDQNYWRGRIWAPMNFLVYLGMRMHDIPQARKEMAEKSANLLLGEWRSHRHVHENYCGDTGLGCNHGSSDRFYHWGALLALIALMEKGFGFEPESPLI